MVKMQILQGKGALMFFKHNRKAELQVMETIIVVIIVLILILTGMVSSTSNGCDLLKDLSLAHESMAFDVCIDREKHALCLASQEEL